MGRTHDTISFLSDYGSADEFVGVVKSVCRSIAPHAQVIDITHEIPAHDIRAGALALARCVQYLAPGVLLAVVDPGVGTDRRAIAVEVGDGEGEAFLVGPDNGLLASAVAIAGGARRAFELTTEKYQLPAPGATFAGRDVFAPAAAHLCNGVDLSELGEEVDPFGLRPGVVPLPQWEDGRLRAEVLWVDRFGNAQLNADPSDIERLGERVTVRAGDLVRTAVRVRAYAELKQGELGLVVDSYGMLALALDQRSAATELRLGAGTGIILEEPGA
jgi:S-adenosylmethionine hydrolase